MKKITAFLPLFLLASCISISVETPTPAASQAFITATLPATQEATPRPTRTTTVVPTFPTRSATEQANCKDSAILISDVTVPDNTKVNGGESFTKTWQFKNTGKCSWTGYTIVYVSGERMDAPDSAPVPDTAAGGTVDISVDLVAPNVDGAYTGNFSLQSPAGNTVAIGTQNTFWVKILVGGGTALQPPSVPTSAINNTASAPGGGNNNCGASQNPAYVNELLQLINAARAEANVPKLSMNDALKSAAQKHSEDMACNNFLDHTGSDNSWISDRIIKAGYNPSYYAEIIAIGSPQNAMDQWAADAPHWESVIDHKVTEIGIGYAYYESSDYDGYFTVDLGDR